MRTRRHMVLVLATLAVASGCAAIIGLEPTETVDDVADVGPGTEAASQRDAGWDDVEEPRDGEVRPIDDGGPCADRVVPSSVAFVETTSGRTCGDPSTVLESDGVGYVGLDFDENATVGEDWDTKYVTGCIGARFTGGPFTSIVVRARSVHKACSNECTSSDGCDTGLYFGLFLKRGSAEPTWLTTQQITSKFADWTIPVAVDAGASPYFIVCRSSAAGRRNDVQVDSIAACR